MTRSRIFLAGVGGQGTLTATNLLSRIALDLDIPVSAGEIHGMAQRGGIVESALLLGGYLSPRLAPGEADTLLGFEPLETMRALPFLKPGGLIISSTDPTYPVAVSLGKEAYPGLDRIQAACRDCASQAWFVACKSLGEQAGTVLSANMVLLGAMCATPASPFAFEQLEAGIERHLPAKIVPTNRQAARLGFEAAAAQS